MLAIWQVEYVTQILIAMSQQKKYCRLCKKIVRGRSDKKFCSNACKNEYHFRLRKSTQGVVTETDKILHRNRPILLECIGKNKKQIRISRTILDKKKFNHSYITGYYINSKEKVYHLIYDFAWMEFSDGSILIIRRG